MRPKKLLIVSLIVCLGVISAACGNTGKSSAAGDSKQTQSSKTTANTSKSGTNSDSNSKDSGTDVSNDSDPFAMMFRMDGVINATLKVESKKPNTTVDYKSRTMTQDGKNVSFSLIPTTKHQKDFKEGSIKALITSGDKTGSAILYNYQVDSANVVSIIDPKSKKVLLVAPIQTQTINKNS